MIIFCAKSIFTLLSIIFNEVSFCMEKTNFVPAHKERHKECVKNCSPVFLLLICSKISERFICYKMFTFFTENNLISPNQSGFRSSDSCFNDLFAITSEIYKSFDNGFEVRRVVLDISKKLLKNHCMKDYFSGSMKMVFLEIF